MNLAVNNRADPYLLQYNYLSATRTTHQLNCPLFVLSPPVSHLKCHISLKYEFGIGLIISRL